MTTGPIYAKFLAGRSGILLDMSASNRYSWRLSVVLPAGLGVPAL
jgi:hypothetical protein